MSTAWPTSAWSMNERWHERWQLVKRVVEARGGTLRKYSFFEDIWRAIGEGARLLLVRAPTGSGKTEAVFAPFAHPLATGEASPWLSMIYALPTRSLVFAMARRLSKALIACGVTRATVTVNYGGLLTITPFLEGDVAVTTYDTMLYAFYGAHVPGYHVLLPMSKILGSLVVLDEIQLLQDVYWYGLSILPYHVGNLLRFGANVVVMSATIPSILSEDLLRSKVKGEVEEVVSKDRPARGSLKVEVVESTLPEGRELAELVRAEVEGQGLFPALIVVNTVEKAVKVYSSLLDSGLDVKPLLLHSRLRVGARRKVEELFEREDLKRERVVLVATQVVEAGLDLDARMLLTELSPVDSLIQRLGRCARRSNGRAIVFTDPGGGRYIYPEELLERTGELVRGEGEGIAEAVSSVEVAQELVDEVYSHDVVDELRRRVEEKISEVKKLIAYTFPSTLFSAGTRKKVRAEPLLRLGAELNCLYVVGESYERLLKCEKVQMPTSELSDRIVRLTVGGQEVPACILHRIGEAEKVVVLEMRLGGDWVELSPRQVDYPELPQYLLGGELFLLNSDSYEIYRSQELGVVKCKYPSAKR